MPKASEMTPGATTLYWLHGCCICISFKVAVDPRSLRGEIFIAYPSPAGDNFQGVGDFMVYQELILTVSLEAVLR